MEIPRCRIQVRNEVHQDYRVVEKISEMLHIIDKEIESFDKSFLYKEKSVLPCQEEYEIACATLDE